MAILDVYRSSISHMAENVWKEVQDGMAISIKNRLERQGYQVQVVYGKFPITVVDLDLLLDKVYFVMRYTPLGKTAAEADAFAQNIIKQEEARYHKIWQSRIIEEMKVYTTALSNKPMKEALDAELGDRVFTDLEYLESLDLGKYAPPRDLEAYAKAARAYTKVNPSIPSPTEVPMKEAEDYLSEAEKVYDMTISKDINKRVNEALEKVKKVFE